ncbi:MAG: LysR family transcriptional regulator [Eubacterium sp.]|nr:LysR family transcriptional regulator [Eubacterium sp.]
MELQQLINFRTVAECQNISMAARQLYISQPSLSKSISRLEADLGVPLFTHRKGRIELNDYGRVFLASTEMALSEIERGAQNVRRMYDSDRHVLSLGSNISGFLPDNLPDFIAAHPEIGIRQLSLSAHEMTEQILQRTLTLGISFTPIEDERIEFNVLGKKEFVLAVGKEHPLSSKKDVRMKELSEETFICDPSRMSVEALRKFCSQEGFTPHVGFEIEDAELIHNLIAKNRGVAILPLGLCARLLVTHPGTGLRLITVKPAPEPTIIGVAHLKGQDLSPAAALFIDFLKKTIKKEDRVVAGIS